MLPRADHARGYAPLARELGRAGVTEVAVVSGVPEAVAGLGARSYPCPFYRPSGTHGAWSWLRLVAARERVARRLLRNLEPSLIMVPSDVADALLPFVAGARRMRIPVVYVQGSVVFADYPRRNDAVYASQWRLRGRVGRLSVRAARALVAAAGIHAALGEKAVLGSRCDLALVMDEHQRGVHLGAGVPAERVVVTGAPFIDALLDLRDHFGIRERRGVREALRVPDGPLVVFLTKSLFQLGWATREAHDRVIREVIGAVRRELPRWICVVKLHPLEALADYEPLVGDDPRVVLARDTPVEPLLLSSDLVLSLGASSPAFAARVFGLPLVLVNFTESEMLDAHAELTASVPTFRKPEELTAALRAAAADRDALRRLVSRAGDDKWRDGRASSRVASRILELLNQ